MAYSDFVAGSTMRSKLTLTASALKSVPSWNVTPCRSLKVHIKPSRETDHSVARPGYKVPSWARSIKRSKTAIMKMPSLTDEVT